MVVELPAAAVQQLKELRMYHWRQAMSLRTAAKNISHTLDEHGVNKRLHRLEVSQNMHKQADFHITACQALNNILPGSGEYDCAEADK
jgi:hypothetical protein